MQAITGADLKKMISAAAECLTNEKERINALNVFPVPDGDTGTNMALTLTAAVRELEQLEPTSIAKVAQAIARGSLMGARGNSGVILSQFFRGFSDGLRKKEIAMGSDLAYAFTLAAQTTYKAVMKPVEGTMLTVGKDIASACTQASLNNTELSAETIWEIGIHAGKISLENTPNILPILKQAGVIDAGGEGLIVALEGALRALRGEIVIQPKADRDDSSSSKTTENNLKAGIISTEGELPNKYCTEFLIQGTNLDANYIRSFLDPRGESILVVGEPDLIKIHIHTDNPGEILEFCIPLGELVDIKIDNMKIQTAHAENVVAFPSQASQTHEPLKPLGVVAVVPGQGLADIFTSLGVDVVVMGGQTMNPSTEELVAAVNQVHAEAVLILPNNKNVIFSAQQVKEFATKQVDVVATRTIPQGIGALMNLSSDVDLAENMTAMEVGMKQVRTGEVTYAVRSTMAGDLRIEEQDIIGLAEGKIAVAGQSIDQVSMQLLQKIVDEDTSVIRVYWGVDRSQEEAEHFAAQIKDTFAQCEIEVYNGGQPLYYYILSVE